MNEDSENISPREDDKAGKSPRRSSINFVKQFARVYSTTYGGEFSYLILN